MKHFVTVGVLLVTIAALAVPPGLSQQPSKPVPAQQTTVGQDLNTGPEKPDNAQRQISDYVLGPGDSIAIAVPELQTEFTDKTFRLDMSGELTLPFAGRVHAAGLTTVLLEQELRSRLSRIIKEPEVVVSLSTFGSQPVSILGAVNNPGVRQVEGRKTLFEVLSLAGGLSKEAGYLIVVTRDMQWGPIPLPGVQVDPAKRTSSASVRVKQIMNAGTAENIPIMPGDSISVPKAEVVYAVGNVGKSGGFMLNEHETLSALQVLSLAEGLQKTAASDKAKIVRMVEGSPNRVEIPVNLKLLLAGKGEDVALRAGDILFVPSSNAKTAGYRTLDVITGMAGGVLVYTH